MTKERREDAEIPLSKLALIEAIQFFGSQTALADAIGTSQQNVSNWLKNGEVPSEFVIPIEKATELTVSRHKLRPDIYPKELNSAA